MQLITRQLPATYNLFLIGDIHIGSILHSDSGLNHAIEMVLSEKNNYVCLMGDIIEAICVDDKRFHPETISEGMLTPMAQAQYAIKHLMPIKDRVLLVLEGNHEVKLQKFGNVTRDIICSGLFGEFQKAKFYGTYSSKLIAKDKKGNIMHKMFLTHGYGTLNSVADDPIRRESNKMLSLKRKLQYKAGDVLLSALAHTHQLLVTEPTRELYLIDDGEELQQKYTHAGSEDIRIPESLRWYCSTGSFLKTFHIGASSYSERFGYNPTELGFIKIEVNDKQISDVKKIML